MYDGHRATVDKPPVPKGARASTLNPDAASVPVNPLAGKNPFKKKREEEAGKKGGGPVRKRGNVREAAMAAAAARKT